MSNDSSHKWQRLLPLYLACYALCLGLAALGVLLIFAARSLMVEVAILLRANPWQVRAVDNFTVVTFGLIWLVGFLLLEHYLRRGVVKQRLWQRAARVLVALAVALGLCYGLRLLL